ncbi:ATP-binding protein [Alkaliphilus transvaalensis]|uniref:ATP-binding protein n=1 Tax=Alkaliphilus transvaalensis TaxID=114628 RepID=UPI0004794F09|nr:AAA family ATPase [Alkaliphilus transvaalensis]
MKIQQITITDFGKFNNISLQPLDSRLVLIYGKNEAGKTTLFHLIKSILFGFAPANREAHPYASWNNDRIEFKATIEPKEGEQIHLHRKLLSNPWGKMTRNDNVIDLRNNPLPLANHISWEIYNKIYALRVEDLIEIQGKAWDEVQDKLLANFGNINIKNTREVLNKINDEANQIYSESNRKKTVIKEIEGKIRELKNKKLVAHERQKKIKDQDQELGKLAEKINNLLQEKIIIKTQLKKAKVLSPINTLVVEKKKLVERLRQMSMVESLPFTTREDLDGLKDQLNKLREELERQQVSLTEKKKKVYHFTEEEKLILSKQNEIEENYQEGLKLETLENELEQLKFHKTKIKDRLKHEARNLLTDDLEEDVIQKIKGLSIPELRLLITSIEALKAQLKEVDGLLHFQKQQKKTVKISNSYMVAGIIGLTLLVLGIYLKQSMIQAMGGISIVFGLSDWFNGQRLKKQLMTETAGESSQEKLSDKRMNILKDLEEKRVKLSNIFADIPIPQLVLDNINELFLTNLIKVKDLIFEVDEKLKILAEKDNDFEVRRKNIESFLKNFGSLNKDLVLIKQLNQLKIQVQELKNLEVINVNLDETVTDLERDVEGLQNKYQQEKSKLNTLILTLTTLGEGSVDAGIERLEENQQLRLKLKHIEDQLSKIHNLDNLLLEIKEYTESNSWIFSDLQLERAEEKVEEIESELQQLKEIKKELEISNGQLLKETSVDEIESEILLLEEEVEALYIKRDRLILLREVIGRAEELFREENQPDVLKNASLYLSKITNGKYTQIYLDNAEDETLIYLKEGNNPIPTRISDSFSKGTLNQLYLSLRLSLIDHLDKNGETLPIAFDELLINWDEERLDNNLTLLKEISRKRQVFIFTCHDWFANKIEATFNTKRIELS